MADWSDHEWKLLIGGESVDGANGTSPIVNPATEEVVGLAPEASVDQALDAARAAQEAFPAWSRHAGRRAGRLLRAVTDQLMKLPGRPRAADHLRDRRHRSPSARGCRCRSRSSASSATPRTRRKNLGIPLPPSADAATPLAPGALMGAHVNRQPVGVVACISPVQLPAHQHRRQDRAGARRRAAPS